MFIFYHLASLSPLKQIKSFLLASVRGRSGYHCGHRGQQDRRGSGRAGPRQPRLCVCARERESDGRRPEHCGKRAGTLCGRACARLEQRKDPCA